MRGALCIFAAAFVLVSLGRDAATHTQPVPLDDTSPGWNCATMGNRLCGAPGGSPVHLLTERIEEARRACADNVGPYVGIESQCVPDYFSMKGWPS